MKPAEPDRMVRSLKINHRKLPPADYSRKVAQHLRIQRRRWLYPSALSRICPVESLGGRAIATQERILQTGKSASGF